MTTDPTKWTIDRSTDSPILTYEQCSVIQDEQAEYVLELIRRTSPSVREIGEPVVWQPQKVAKAVYDAIKDSIRDFEDFNEVYDKIRTVINSSAPAPQAPATPPPPAPSGVVEALFAEQERQFGRPGYKGQYDDWTETCDPHEALCRFLDNAPHATEIMEMFTDLDFVVVPLAAIEEQAGWRSMDSAPKGIPSEDVGCREASEWFLARPGKKYRNAGTAPMVVVQRRAWPQEDNWVDNGETHYRSDYFDGWLPLPVALSKGETNASKGGQS